MTDSGQVAGSSLLGTLVAAAERSGWTVQPLGGTSLGEEPSDELHVVMRNEEGGVEHPVLVSVHGDASVIVCSSILPERMPPTRHAAVMESTTRANSGLLEGKFELDLDDGEVRFTTSAFVLDDLSTEQVEAMFGHLLAFNLVAFDAYRPVFAVAEFGGADLAQVIAAVESGESERD
jgi:hypothetical protein